MIDHGSFIAEILDSSAKGLAAGAVLRQSELTETPASGLFSGLVEETEIRIRYLGEALAADRPVIFEQYIHWLRDAYAMREVPLELLHANLSGMRDELERSLPADSVGLALDPLDRALASALEAPPELRSLLEEDAPHVKLAQKFALALLEARRDDAIQLLLSALDDGVSITDLYTQVIGRVQGEMGRMWQRGEVNCAEEHLVSRIVEEALLALRSKMPLAEPKGLRVITASVMGEQHDIGARMVSDHFSLAGWEALFLGADTPTSDLVRAVVDFDADLLALSVSLGLHVRATADLVARVRRACPTPILVGGGPFALVPDLWSVVGADGSATSLADAVVMGEQLVAR